MEPVHSDARPWSPEFHTIMATTSAAYKVPAESWESFTRVICSVESLERIVANQAIRLLSIVEQTKSAIYTPTGNIIYQYHPIDIATSIPVLKTQLKLLRRTVLAQDACLRGSARRIGIDFTSPYLKLPKKTKNITPTWAHRIQPDFLASIEDLKVHVSWLRRETASNRDRLASIEHLIGLEFTLFSRLPAEIQSMIWKYAAYVPRIVAIKTIPFRHKCFISNSPPSPLLLTTTEARAEALKVLRPITRPCRTAKGMILANPLVDTMWILGGNMSGFKSYDCVLQAVSYVGFPLDFAGTPIIERLAFPYQFWKEAEDNNKTLEILDAFKVLGTREVILVVGNETISQSPDVIFEEPKERPGRHSDAKVNKWYGTTNCRMQRWDLLAEHHLNALECAIDEAGDNSNDDNEDSDDNSEDDSDDGSNEDSDDDSNEGSNPKNWPIPNIRYMEVTTMKGLDKVSEDINPRRPTKKKKKTSDIIGGKARLRLMVGILVFVIALIFAPSNPLSFTVGFLFVLPHLEHAWS